MKRLLVVVLLGMLLVGCADYGSKGDGRDADMYEIYYKGHTYLKFGVKDSIVHNPDCDCHKK